MITHSVVHNHRRQLAIINWNFSHMIAAITVVVITELEMFCYQDRHTQNPTESTISRVNVSVSIPKNRSLLGYLYRFVPFDFPLAPHSCSRSVVLHQSALIFSFLLWETRKATFAFCVLRAKLTVDCLCVWNSHKHKFNSDRKEKKYANA